MQLFFGKVRQIQRTEPDSVRFGIPHIQGCFQLYMPRTRITLTRTKVVEKFQVTPTLLQRVGQQVGLSCSSTQHATQELRLKLCKVSLIKELQLADPAHWHNYYQRFLNYAWPITKLNVMFSSDEAWFTLSGNVNAQNNQYWSQENLYQFLEAPLHVEKIKVWAAVSHWCVVASVFHMRVTSEVSYYHNPIL